MSGQYLYYITRYFVLYYFVYFVLYHKIDKKRKAKTVNIPVKMLARISRQKFLEHNFRNTCGCGVSDDPAIGCSATGLSSGLCLK